MDLDFYQALTDAGVKPAQARETVNALHREIEKETRLTMSEYIKRADLHTEIAEFATKSDSKATKNELKVDIEKLKNTMIQWFIGSSVSIVALALPPLNFSASGRLNPTLHVRAYRRPELGRDCADHRDRRDAQRRQCHRHRACLPRFARRSA